ncbi:MAG: hypothetical protein ACFCUO_07770 [Rhodospirillales bacterium]
MSTRSTARDGCRCPSCSVTHSWISTPASRASMPIRCSSIRRSRPARRR